MTKVTSSSATFPPANTYCCWTKKPCPNKPTPPPALYPSQSPPALKPPPSSPSPPCPIKSKNSHAISRRFALINADLAPDFEEEGIYRDLYGGRVVDVEQRVCGPLWVRQLSSNSYWWTLSYFASLRASFSGLREVGCEAIYFSDSMIFLMPPGSLAG